MQKRSSLAIVKAVIFALVLRELRTRFNSRRMGIFWFMFEPLAYMLVMVFDRVFLRSVNMKIGGMDYAMFLVTGIVPFLMFKNIVLLGMGAIDANRGLFAYHQIKPLDCIMARVVVECVMRALVYALLVFIMGFWLGYDVSIARPLEWLGIILLGILFSFSLSIILCIWSEAMPNAKIFVTLVFMPLYFLSDVLIPVSKLPSQVQSWLAWNPFFQLSVQLRMAIDPGYPILPGISAQHMIFATLVLLLIGLALYHSRRDKLLSI